MVIAPRVSGLHLEHWAAVLGLTRVIAEDKANCLWFLENCKFLSKKERRGVQLKWVALEAMGEARCWLQAVSSLAQDRNVLLVCIPSAAAASAFLLENPAGFIQPVLKRLQQ